MSVPALAPRQLAQAARQIPPSATGAAVALLPAGVVLGALVSLSPLLVLVGAAVVGLGTLVFVRPPAAAYLLTGLTPLLVGIDRGRIVPMLRPNEALLLLCAVALAARGVWNLRTGARLHVRLSLVTCSLVLMAAFNSVVPLAWMLVRGVPISGDDITYAVVLWKYLVLYAVVRASVSTGSQAVRCLWVAMGAASIVAVIAIMQSVELFGIEEILNSYYAPFGDTTLVSNNRGSATLGLAAATADLMIFNLALAAGFWHLRAYPARLLAPMAALFVVGTLASGQFSAMIGLVVAIVALGVVFRRAAIPGALVVTGLAAALLLQPVVANRLAGFSGVSGLPESWVGRLYNLQNYFWPKLFSDYNFLLGVQPSARVPSPGTLALPWVWIESGYTWLLWGGGVPLLLSYALFTVVTTTRSWRAARRPDAVGVAATAVFVAVLVISVLMLFDPHLTYRGSADLFFSLLAMLVALDNDRTARGGKSSATEAGTATRKWVPA